MYWSFNFFTFITYKKQTLPTTYYRQKTHTDCGYSLPTTYTMKTECSLVYRMNINFNARLNHYK